MFFKNKRTAQHGPGVRIHFLGAAQTVTGSFHFLEVNDGGRTTRFFIDAGRIQEDESLNYQNRLPRGVKASQINFALFTHAHDDHVGNYPVLWKQGFTGPSYGTKPTVDFMGLSLPDSGHLQEEEAKARQRLYRGKDRGPLYTEQDARRALKLLQGVQFNKSFVPAKNVSVEFLPSSHLLGAAQVVLEIGRGQSKRTIAFSGDIGRPGMPMLKDMAPVKYADYIICESTYGNRLHPKNDRLNSLCDTINRAYGRASVPHKVHGYGTIVIPVFALGRAQEVLYDLRTLMTQGRLPARIPVFLDSPMASKATDIYRKHIHEFPAADRRLAAKIDLFRTPRYEEGINNERSSQINQRPSEPTIIVSSSGMAGGGRVVEHLKHRLPGPQNTVIFVGHQAEGTRGAQLTGGADSVHIDGETINVRATIENLQEYSGHADYEEMLNWLSKFQRRPKKLFLVHGDVASQEAFKARIERQLGWDVVIPQMRSSFDLT
jgi:metallo-beta-lactamase family protein